ncbi:helix-turn-helix domain-containing protein [Streptomyces prunicolor]|uniref:Helix-turn-helix transcriptional regulator n=1 Tax=Streptomyces prunicolor TaxID=67348 RepID=A0ABU4FD16_9ACTN|nr:helix-turn-helix transcriptional regulator [Streptomyces prunicolor]MDV7218485.1 helix-turn-helix transcriptional regulator [Streptomyces prunicolor]
MSGQSNANSLPPPVAWRYSGNQLKRWRTKANVSREELAAASNYSPDTIKSMEQGVRMPTPRVLDVADGMCRAEGLLSAAKDYLQREKFPARAQDFMEREKEAISHWSYETTLVPGLLQTEGYARALIGGRYPPVAQELVEERVAARLERQFLLTRTPPAVFVFLIYEAALHTPLVDGEQLGHILDMARLGNVLVQVLPFERFVSTALVGSMVLLETDDHERHAYSTGQSMSQLTTDPAVVSAHLERLSLIRTMALSPAETAQFIERMAAQR